MAALLLSLLSDPVRADGGFLGFYGQDVWEPEQKALLLYDAAEQIESLILQVRYEGEAREFAWIIPTPARPTLDEADPWIFSELSNMTSPVVRDRGFGCMSDSKPMGTLPPDDDVIIYEQGRIGIYESLVVGATEAGALTDSLTSWGFLHVQNRERAESAFQYYIDREWCFVALRVDSSTVAREGGELYWHGGFEPIRLTFHAARPVYPMRISALSAPAYTNLLLYVAASHRMTFAGASAEYANRLTPGEFEAVERSHRALGPVLGGPCFVTKLRRTMSPSQMTEDLMLEQAPNDQEFLPVHMGAVPIVEILLLPGIWVASRWRSRRRIRMPRL